MRRAPFLALAAMVAIATLGTSDSIAREPEPREPEPPPDEEPPPTLRSVTGIVSSGPGDVGTDAIGPMFDGPTLTNKTIVHRRDISPADRRELASATAKRARKAARRLENAKRAAKV